MVAVAAAVVVVVVVVIMWRSRAFINPPYDGFASLT